MVAFLTLPFFVFSQHLGPEAQVYLLNNQPEASYFYGFIFAVFGLFLHWVYDTRKGIANSEKSPAIFKLDYWLFNNFFEKVLSILSVYVGIFILIRFANEHTTTGATMFFAFAVGFVFDKLMKVFLDIVRKMSFFSKDKNLIR